MGVNGGRRPRRALALGAAIALVAGGVAGAAVYLAGRSGNEHRTPVARTHRPAPAPAPLPAPRPHVVEPEAGSMAAAGLAPTGPPPRPPSDAQVRSELAAFQTISQRFHYAQHDFSSALLDPSQLPSGGWQESIASVFTDYFKPIACGGVLHPYQLGVAHKTAPCGTMITFRWGHRAITVPVIDRGPYGEGREWDLTGATAAALHFPGLGRIHWRVASLPGRPHG